MIVAHGLAQSSRQGIRQRFRPMPSLSDQPSLPQQFIPLKNQLLVPALPAQSEVDGDPALPVASNRRIVRTVRPII